MEVMCVQLGIAKQKEAQKMPAFELAQNASRSLVIDKGKTMVLGYPNFPKYEEDSHWFLCCSARAVFSMSNAGSR